MLKPDATKLLVACARQQVDPGKFRALVSAVTNWEELIRAAWRHGVLPLLFHHLKETRCDDVLPADAHALLRQSFVRAAARTNGHTQAVAELAEVFGADRVPMLLLKGAALAYSVYRTPVSRPFADIDLLVRKEQIDDAERVLQRCGYQTSPDLLSERLNRKYHANLPFVRHGARPVHIELHWRLTDAFNRVSFDHDALFERGAEVCIGSTKARSLGPYDALVYLAVHLDNHGHLNRSLLDHPQPAAIVLDPLSGNRLIWFTDLHERMTAQPIDHVAAATRAREAGASEAVGVTLRLLQRVLATPIADELLDALPVGRVPFFRRAAGRYMIKIASHEKPESRARSLAERFLLRTRKGFEVRLVRVFDLWEYIFPPRSTREAWPAYSGRALREIGKCGSIFVQLQLLRLARLTGGRRA